MISRVRGRLVGKEIDRAEVETPGGVVYELVIPSAVYQSLPSVGSEVELYAAVLMRDEALELYGFQDDLERRLFLRLKSASGIGPRLALTLLGTLAADQLIDAIRERDLTRLQTVSGVGKKKAERIVVELADKLEDMAATAIAAKPQGAIAEAAVEALVALGYSRGESQSAVRRAAQERDGGRLEVETLVKRALAGMS